ncbi:YciI family protein [Pseudonocardia sp. GCM10023141]|uniref:YciI family protein n=1 Tax=Pseudonocardia sp. GCM10023141 TaxID=3252653 RepID=UPI00361B26A0
MSEITDEYMQEQLGRSRVYTLAMLRPGPKYGTEGSDAVIWEHGRRNFELRAAGTMSIVGPVMDGTDLAGISILTASVEEAAALLDGDPAVQAGLFGYELHPLRSFPGDALG